MPPPALLAPGQVAASPRESPMLRVAAEAAFTKVDSHKVLASRLAEGSPFERAVACDVLGNPMPLCTAQPDGVQLAVQQFGYDGVRMVAFRLSSPTNPNRLLIGPHGNRTGAPGAFIDETTMPVTMAMAPRNSTIRIRPESTKWLDGKAGAAVAFKQTLADPTRWELSSHRACRMSMGVNGVQYNAFALYRFGAYGFEFDSDSATLQPAAADLTALLFYPQDDPVRATYLESPAAQQTRTTQYLPKGDTIDIRFESAEWLVSCGQSIASDFYFGGLDCLMACEEQPEHGFAAEGLFESGGMTYIVDARCQHSGDIGHGLDLLELKFSPSSGGDPIKLVRP